MFTHCVEAECRTRVGDNVWQKSWDDLFLDYEKWIAAGEPDGYVWVRAVKLIDAPSIEIIDGSGVS